MTILITKNTLNIIALTLTELQDDSLDVNWLFVFSKDQGKQEVKCYLTDLSVSTARFNLFHLIEGTDATFTKLGDYMYRVFQMPDGGSLDETEGIQVEIGKVRVVDSVTVVQNSFSPTLTANIYGGETVS